MKSQILLYEPNVGCHPKLAFLLGIEEVSGTYARSAAEALNWLEAIKLRVVSFDLVLISSWCGSPEHPIPDPFFPDPIICNDDNLISCLNDCLTLSQGEADDRRANNSC